MGCGASKPVAPHAEAEAESKRILEALLATVDFSDLATAPGGCFRIEDTAKRAITLDQMESVVKHTAKRLGCEMEFGDDDGIKINATWKQTRDDGERWLGKRPQGPDGELVEVEVKFNEVNLYDLDKYVIRPATEEKQCAMVELMASGEQPPDFFVSHYWAEPILEFFKCLLEHAWARGFEEEQGNHNGREMGKYGREPHPLYLGGRSPRYWVCAYANNQWTLASELVEDLAETSFARAMRISMGTVSVVDRSAGCFGRIWCVYELSYSVRREDKKEFMYDIVTAKEWEDGYDTHGAVAITDGLSAQQWKAQDKLAHEQAFPLELIDKGIAFKCKDGQASFEADKVRILKAIGDGSETLDAKVHGVVACAALRRALEEGGTRRETFLEAVRNGKVRKLQLSLAGSAADTAETWREVVGALDATATEELSMQTWLEGEFPVSSFGRLTSLTSINVSECKGLTSLPEGLFSGLTSLTSINMQGCRGLTSLPDLSGLTSLTSINMSGCRGLTSLPDLSGLTSLKELDMYGCMDLELPAELVEELKARGVEVKGP